MAMEPVVGAGGGPRRQYLVAACAPSAPRRTRSGAPRRGAQGPANSVWRSRGLCRAIEMDLSETPRVRDWLTRCLDRKAAREALELRYAADAAVPVEVTRTIARLNRL